jgi:hypothetical protein
MLSKRAASEFETACSRTIQTSGADIAAQGASPSMRERRNKRLLKSRGLLYQVIWQIPEELRRELSRLDSQTTLHERKARSQLCILKGSVLISFLRNSAVLRVSAVYLLLRLISTKRGAEDHRVTPRMPACYYTTNHEPTYLLCFDLALQCVGLAFKHGLGRAVWFKHDSGASA